jgi:valyl-tRNA synthetase
LETSLNSRIFVNIDLPTQYDPHSVEAPIYQKWLDAKAFHAVPDARPNKFSIVIPPPNVTGALHLGHAINGTIQDILTRYHRMKGDNTLWMPGIDHAGIATQAVVEKTIFEKEKKNRHDLGREELVRRIWEWKEQYGSRILNQQAQLGASCDWDRTRFTLDDICAKAVREAFFKMFKDGLIFRGKRLVNWDTHLQTAVADDEIYHEHVKGQMTSIKYPVDDGSGNLKLDTGNVLIVATTRPETMLGDTAVAVHPDDPRYTHLHGKFVIVPLVGRRIPIITDGLLVDPAFGTGVVKVTPAHDPNDYATGQRHHLEQINLLTPDGKMNEKGSGVFLGKEYSYTGLKFATAARKQILADLEGLGLIADKKIHEHQVGHSDRSKTPIEPYLSDQWFVRMGDITVEKPSEPRPSGSGLREQPSHPKSGHPNAMGYFLTFHTYATWLRGEEPGSVDDSHNTYGAAFIAPDPELFSREMANAKNAPLVFSNEQRQSVCQTMAEVAQHRGWVIHAVNVRSTHVHAVVSGDASPEKMMNDFKAYATRHLREAGLVSADAKVWSRHGSMPYLWKEEDIAGAVDYTLHRQGENLSGACLNRKQFENSMQPLPNGRGSDGFGASGITLANGQKSSGLAQAAMDAVTDGRVKITPDRYAKGYLDWLAQKRDWCISRQLWWGHRIPVWSKTEMSRSIFHEIDVLTREPLEDLLRAEGRQESIHLVDAETGVTWRPDLGEFNEGPDRLVHVYMCFTDGYVPDAWERNGWERDPDVLDTWFSSALWPISTMGWPSTGTSDKPEDQLLPYFYPTAVLSTARDILTLWVARMVIFGLYCHGQIPFKDVYIHAVIQDGEGRTMSKSKGNGVDPVDIINSHGADALRFTLASMATETQDIRMPVVKDPTTGTNTSPKFDIGRNFANKIWNATRFILTNIEENSEFRIQNSELKSLEDRWILSRLNTTITTVEAAINGFHFADVAESLRTFFWTDLCDWYLEIAKARIRAGDALVQSILLHCLETTLKLLHPMMPFITEELWGKLPNRPSMLIIAQWPTADPSLLDTHAESQITLVQSLTTAIREIQNRYPAARGKDIVLAPRDAATQSTIDASRLIIEALTSAKIAENSPTAQKPENAAAAILPDGGGVQIFIGGVIDKTVEIPKLTKRKTELLEKLIPPQRAKLANEAAIAKVPPAIAQGWRDQLAKYEEELATLEKNLQELGE